MPGLREVAIDASFPPFAVLRDQLGFVPRLFRAQTLLPRAIDAETALAESILFKEQALSRVQKERMLLALAASGRNPYCVALHYQMSCLSGTPEEQLDQVVIDYRQAGLSAADTALLDFTLRLGRRSLPVSSEEVSALLAHGWTDESVLEAVQVAAFGKFLCTLATGLGVEPDFQTIPIPASRPVIFLESTGSGSAAHLRAPSRSADDFAPFAFFREQFGFIPNIFRAQTLHPDVVEAEAAAVRDLLLTEDVLTRVQKERILLAVSAANGNSYFVAVHAEILATLGVPVEDCDQLVADHRQARLDPADQALLDFCLNLAARPSEVDGDDREPLRRHGLTDEQILEAIVMTAFANFLNTLAIGLGAEPDFSPRHVFPPKTVNLLDRDARPTQGIPVADPDAESVARVQSGDLDAFEALINRHSRRVYRTLVGILGNPEEARDAMQDTFLKAFQHLQTFQGRSKFSTWLVSIANNTGLQILRERRNVQSLDDEGFEADEGFRPQQVRAWSDDPEQLYSKVETKTLVEKSVMRLPAKYRVVVMLRDIENLSVEESAAVLGLGVPALKTRLLRGRLMMREALAPHFAKSVQGGVA